MGFTVVYLHKVFNAYENPLFLYDIFQISLYSSCISECLINYYETKNDTCFRWHHGALRAPRGWLYRWRPRWSWPVAGSMRTEVSSAADVRRFCVRVYAK